VRAGVVALGAVSLLALGLSACFGLAGDGDRSIDREPISLDQANALRGIGLVYRIAIRPEGDTDEYFLSTKGPDGRRWTVAGIDVHVFTTDISTGVPILSSDGGSIGLTSTQLVELLERVELHNATATTPIDMLDERG
jgi:hypothetical protein